MSVISYQLSAVSFSFPVYCLLSTLGFGYAMDYRKIDASLVLAIDEVSNPEELALVVFIHTEHVLSDAEGRFLRRLGIGEVIAGRQAFTATLSARAVEELSEQPWVRCIKLSRKLKLVNDK